jgi:hypothetical protein
MPTLQQTIGYGFGAAPTAGDVVRNLDLSGRIAVVAGGCSGIGLETTRALRSARATVIVPAPVHDQPVTKLEDSTVRRSRRWTWSAEPRSPPRQSSTPRHADLFSLYGWHMTRALIGGQRHPKVLAQLERSRMLSKIGLLEEAFVG